MFPSSYRDMTESLGDGKMAKDFRVFTTFTSVSITQWEQVKCLKYIQCL